MFGGLVDPASGRTLGTPWQITATTRVEISRNMVTVFAGNIYLLKAWWMFQPRYFWLLFRQKECWRLQKDPEMRLNYHQLQGFFAATTWDTLGLSTFLVYSGKWRFTGIPYLTCNLVVASSLGRGDNPSIIPMSCHLWLLASLGIHLETPPKFHSEPPPLKGTAGKEDDPFLLGETVRTGKLQVGNSLTKVTSRLPEISECWLPSPSRLNPRLESKNPQKNKKPFKRTLKNLPENLPGSCFFVKVLGHVSPKPPVSSYKKSQRFETRGIPTFSPLYQTHLTWRAQQKGSGSQMALGGQYERNLIRS